MRYVPQMPRSKLRIGIDLGGTKIEAAALGANGEELARRRVPTPPGYEASLEAITNLVADAEQQPARTGPVGTGTPGIAVPATGLAKTANSACVNHQPRQRGL